MSEKEEEFPARLADSMERHKGILDRLAATPTPTVPPPPSRPATLQATPDLTAIDSGNFHRIIRLLRMTTRAACRDREMGLDKFSPKE
jgi:hypothetical protein